MKLNEFINLYLGKKIDYDNAFGAQCVDVFRQYCKDVLDIPHTGAVEGAKDLFLNYDNFPLEQKYFEKKSIENIYYGDVIIWDKTETNKYGHVAIVVSKLENEVAVIEQNGFKQDGLKFQIRSLDNCLGILRFRKKIC